MKGINLTVVIVIAIVAIVFIYLANQRARLEQQARMLEGQTALINAQTAQQSACQNSWVCATTNILGGLTGLVGSTNLTGLFSGSNQNS
jgi:hypothetical protein